MIMEIIATSFLNEICILLRFRRSSIYYVQYVQWTPFPQIWNMDWTKLWFESYALYFI